MGMWIGSGCDNVSFEHKYILGLSEPVGKITKEHCFTGTKYFDIFTSRCWHTISPKAIQLGSGTSNQFWFLISFVLMVNHGHLERLWFLVCWQEEDSVTDWHCSCRDVLADNPIQGLCALKQGEHIYFCDALPAHPWSGTWPLALHQEGSMPRFWSFHQKSWASWPWEAVLASVFSSLKRRVWNKRKILS